MRLAFFEDSNAADFAPIALLRPVFELLCGRFSLRERLLRQIRPTEWGAFVRTYLRDVVREEFPEARINDSAWLASGATLLANSRWLPSVEALLQLQTIDETVAIYTEDRLVALQLDGSESALLSDTEWDDALLKIAGTRRKKEMSGHLLKRPWDLITLNGEMLIQDFQQFSAHELTSGQSFRTVSGDSSLSTSSQRLNSQVAVLGNPANVLIDTHADIDPFVVIDARNGPVVIDAGTRIQAFTRIEGPCVIGRGTELFRANVKAGTTIGPVCRIGGEIEESIIHGFANKYHDGFLGHSYVCPWTNLGALTSNSDLKNDYSNVSVPLQGESIPTGSKKIGAFIGDHTKTALCSMFNTGSSIGVMTMILPGGELIPKFVPSFSRLWHGDIDDGMNFESAIETARRAMGRRNCELTAAQERLLRFLHHETRQERQTAIGRSTPRIAEFTTGNHR